jgi:hypothetical protein
VWLEATIYVHKLSPCGWGAHLKSHLPEHSLGSIPGGKAILASCSHKAGEKPTGPWNIPWPAGRIIQGGNLQQILRINKQQSICSVLPSLEMHHLHTCEFFMANVKLCKKRNHAACQWSMTTWNDYNITNQNKIKNNKMDWKSHAE